MHIFTFSCHVMSFPSSYSLFLGSNLNNMIKLLVFKAIVYPAFRNYFSYTRLITVSQKASHGSHANEQFHNDLASRLCFYSSISCSLSSLVCFSLGSKLFSNLFCCHSCVFSANYHSSARKKTGTGGNRQK